MLIAMITLSVSAHFFFFFVYIHLLMPNLDTSSVMFLESLDVSGLSTSYALLQVTQPGMIRPQLVSRWLASYHDSMAPLF